MNIKICIMWKKQDLISYVVSRQFARQDMNKYQEDMIFQLHLA